MYPGQPGGTYPGQPGGTYPGWQPPAPQPPAPAPQPGQHRARNAILGVVGGLVLLLIGVGIGAAGEGTPGPAPTVTVTARAAPAPAASETAQAPAPPAAGNVIGRWSGTGNQVTPAFSAPASGNYIVKWAYSGNVDPSLGGATNFIIGANDPNATADGLPNDIAASGHGSTEVTGASGSQSFNVQAAGHWTIKVISAP